MTCKISAVFATTLLLTGCAGSHFAPGFFHRSADNSQSNTTGECEELAAEIAQQRAVATNQAEVAEAPFTSAATHDNAAQKLQSLEARREDLGCSRAPAGTSVTAPTAAPAAQSGSVAPPPGSSAGDQVPQTSAAATQDAAFNRCFTRCRAYTDRSKDQCFDVCNRGE